MSKPLQPPARHHLSAAQGWLELGNHQAAYEELSKISPTLSAHPDVLEIRWQVGAKAQNWETCLYVASALTLSAPENPQGWTLRASALHQLERTREARDCLLHVVSRFPNDSPMHYHLACYECWLGNPQQALAWLAKAFDLAKGKDPTLRVLAGPDLKSMWRQMGNSLHS
jgi:tetratricopeptide (TPR) repeat protein